MAILMATTLDRVAYVAACKYSGLAQAAMFCMMALLTATLLFPFASVQGESYTEYEVKAAFLYQFIPFVEWPSDAFADDDAPFVIGVLGEDPFGDILDNTVREKKAHNRDIVIRRSKNPGALATCHVVFIAASERDNIGEAMKTFNAKSVLTLGEWESFTKQGGIIRFLVTGGKIGFEINIHSARKAGLKISSQLLRLAQVVDDGGKRGNS